jgi:PadR family transcriptional regulator PadR
MTVESSPTRKFRRELHAGLSSLLLLSAVSTNPMYAYEIAKLLEERHGKPLPMKLGALYPVLHSLESQGLVSSYHQPSEAGPRRRYFQITTEGRTALEQWTNAWMRMRDLVDTILGDEDARSR